MTFRLTINDLGGVGTPTLGSRANGTATIEVDGQATYIPDAGFTGDDSFPYRCARRQNRPVHHRHRDRVVGPRRFHRSWSTGRG